ncbi:MAG: DUF58 domain-containing protein [Dehalococcoidales bacterium]|nr:DUF58 domain-containing protein [Dehalococcoidales bacterium]
MKTRLVWISILVTAMLAFALLFGSALLLRLFYLSILILLASYAWVVYNIRKLSLKTGAAPAHLQVGDDFQREVTLTNNSRLPRLWLKLQDRTDLGPQDSTLVNLPGQDSKTWKTNFTCLRRGRFHLGPVDVTSFDPLGIFSRQITLGDSQSVIIYPQAVDLPHFKFSSFSDFGYNDSYLSATRISSNASSVREFASGDSLRHIHWQSTLRTGKFMVKMFDADRSYNASKIGWILLDMNEESHFGRQLDTTDEQAIVIAASVAQNYLQGGMKVGLMASDAERSYVAPERGQAQLWQILEKLALMKTDWRSTLKETVNKNLDDIRDNPLVIIIATTTSTGLIDTIRQLKNRVDAVVVILLDVASWQGSPILTDMQRTLTWTGAQVYMVHKGEKIATALDSKITHVHPYMV